MKRTGLAAICFVGVLAVVTSCARREPLTAEKAERIIRSLGMRPEPVYAEVPQRVWWGPKAPKDEYDEKALQTLRNLEKVGLVTITETQGTAGSMQYLAKVTEKGFRILGTVPSARGPAFRAQIAQKVYDDVRNFQRHPNEETTGHAEIVWHYDNPTWLYPLFETKMNKPLKTPFASHVSFYYKDHAWRFDVTVPKIEADAVPQRGAAAGADS